VKLAIQKARIKFW